jgi:RHS repeat-associated protein
LGEKASVTLLFVTLGLFEPISAAWAKKDKVDVTLTEPVSGALYNAPAAIVLSAIAREMQKSHPIVKVEFFQGTNLIGAVAGPRQGDQYTLNWAGVAAGNYAVTAKATNDKGDTDLSDPVSITVNALPSVSIMTPGNNTILTAPATFTVTASASDSDGAIAKVEFYNGAKLVGAATSAPYSVTLSNAAAGFLNLAATATDNRGASTTSAPVTVIVNSLPTVSLTSPTSNAAFKAPANIPLAVQVADADGSIANVDYFYGTTLITSLSAPPYSFVWTEVPQGTYALTARVTDNLGGAMTSVAVNVTVNAAEAKLYYIHVDHLNTPRLITDDQQRTVWRWDQQEPFGVNAPDENPSGLGVFEFPLRGPGQYSDKESGGFYNYFRDFDPGTGRYRQSDLIGLLAGLNTYSYVTNSPLRYADPQGLDETIWNITGDRGVSDGPRNGNWCGKNWSGGWAPSAHGGLPGPMGPVDSLDSCCKTHDLCWDSCEHLIGDPMRYRDCRYKCDKNIVKCLNDLDPDCNKWAHPARAGTEADSDIFRDDALRYWADEVRKYESRMPK